VSKLGHHCKHSIIHSYQHVGTTIDIEYKLVNARAQLLTWEHYCQHGGIAVNIWYIC